MNFIEAALLIQGSACIYSKKVRRWRWSKRPGLDKANVVPQKNVST